jgi:hypothetical protein
MFKFSKCSDFQKKNVHFLKLLIFWNKKSKKNEDNQDNWLGPADASCCAYYERQIGAPIKTVKLAMALNT